MTLDTPANTTADVDDAALDALRASLSGTVLRPGDDGYDEARTIFNGMIDRRPGADRPLRRDRRRRRRRSGSPASTACWSACAAAATTWPATPSATAA